ncbi:MAG: hypothetical protein JEZ02_00095 [Desulfatibacillum sp.]|nr:hypothetical protein [Desulfatibacillum sp.]
MNGFDMIDRDYWIDKMSPEQRDWTLYEYLHTIHSRLVALENRKWVHRTLSFAGGVLGGAGVVVIYWQFFKDLVK